MWEINITKKNENNSWLVFKALHSNVAQSTIGMLYVAQSLPTKSYSCNRNSKAVGKN